MEEEEAAEMLDGGALRLTFGADEGAGRTHGLAEFIAQVKKKKQKRAGRHVPMRAPQEEMDRFSPPHPNPHDITRATGGDGPLLRLLVGPRLPGPRLLRRGRGRRAALRHHAPGQLFSYPQQNRDSVCVCHVVWACLFAITHQVRRRRTRKVFWVKG